MARRKRSRSGGSRGGFGLGGFNSYLAGAGAAAVQRKFLPQFIPFQGAAAGYLTGKMNGAIGGFVYDALIGGGSTSTASTGL